MARIKKTAAIGGAVALIATMFVVGVPNPASAGVVAVECVGDDAVLAGSVGGNPTPSQDILNLFDPDNTPVVLENDVQVDTEPTSLLPDTEQEINFFATILLSDALVDSASEFGVESIDFKSPKFVLKAGTGVTGPDLNVTADDGTVVLEKPLNPPRQGPFTGTYTTTGAIGSAATFELESASIGVELEAQVFPAPAPKVAVTMGLSCTPVSSKTVVEAFILPAQDDRGPKVPDVTASVKAGESVTVDLVEEGLEPSDLAGNQSPARIESDPENGTASVSGFEITYTPNAGFPADGENATDQLIYEVCTEPFVVSPGVNEVQNISFQADAGTFTLGFMGETTVPLFWDQPVAQVQSALEDLSTIGESNVSVLGNPGNYNVTFGGQLAEQNVEALVASGNLTDGGAAADITVVESVQGAAPETETVCNSGVLTIEASGAPVATTTTTTTTAPPAPPAPVTPASPTFTG